MGLASSPSRSSRDTRIVTLLSIRGEPKKKKKKSNPVFQCKSQVSFVSGDYNGNGRGVKV